MSSNVFTNSLGLTKPESQYDPQIANQVGVLQDRANNPNGIATQAYQKMANQGMGNVISGIAQTKGLRPSAAATMSDIAGSRIQGETAQNAGLMGLQEQQMNQNMLSNLLMGASKQDLDQQNLQANRFGTFLKGVGATVAAA